MVRQKSKPTKYPGVRALSGAGQYRIRAKTKDPRTGKSIELDRMVKAKDAREASALRAEALADLQSPAQQVERPRLGPYARSWVLAREPALKRSTAERYASTLELHIIPAFEDWYLDALDEDAIASWRDRMTADGAKTSTVNSRLRVLRTMLEDAVPKHLSHNPATKVRAVRERGGREVEPNRLVPTEIGRVLDAMRRKHESDVRDLEIHMAKWPMAQRRRVPNAYPIVLALISTGMRWGEVSALKWSDIDERRRTITVSRAQFRGTVDSTKTGVVRSVPLTDELAAVLQEHRVLLVTTQHPGLRAGWVFPSTSGGPKGSASIREALQEALAEAGVARRQTVHGLRRTFNDLLRQITSGEVVRSMTGHSSQAMTGHYSHVAETEKSAAVSRAFQVIRGGDRGGDAGGSGEA